jgi:hypothetical protein
MYEQIINSAIDFSILIMESFLAFYLLSEMLPTATTEPTAASTAKPSDNITATVEAEDILEIIAPTLVESQGSEIVGAALQSLNLPVKELVAIAKQHKVKGCSKMCKGAWFKKSHFWVTLHGKFDHHYNDDPSRNPVLRLSSLEALKT